jgi:hypothetical protein
MPTFELLVQTYGDVITGKEGGSEVIQGSSLEMRLGALLGLGLNVL